MPHDASHERVSRLTGIALMCGAVACFAMLDTTAKYLNLYMSTLQVVWARYTGAFLFPFIVSNPWTRPGLTRTNRPALQIARSVLLLASTLCNFLALRYLQLAEAIALVFSTPFFVAALSGPMLGEWVHWRRWTAIAVGFVGVLVVTRPGAPIPTRPPCSIRTSWARWPCFRWCPSCGRRPATPSSSRSWWRPARWGASVIIS
jgi:drug/metabolite transporter (DMT)-like permease